MAEFSLLALKSEIETDPLGLGYKDGATWKADQVIADLINAKNYKIDRAWVEMEAIRALIEYDWYDTLSIDEQEFLRWKTPNSGNWLVTAAMKLILSGRALCSNGVAGTGNDTDSWWAAAYDQDAAPAMLALIEVDGSRAEVLWGEGTFITASHVGRAFNE